MAFVATEHCKLKLESCWQFMSFNLYKWLVCLLWKWNVFLMSVGKLLQIISNYRGILADVIVYIFTHLHSALPTEGKVLDINWLQAAKELVKFNTWWKFWLFVCNIQGEIVFQKLQNLWVAKALMSSYILCKILSFLTHVAQKVFNRPGSYSHSMIKSMSTRGPGRGDTCHLTDFSETWPDWRTYPITQRAKTVLQLQFSGGSYTTPLLFLHKFFEILH